MKLPLSPTTSRLSQTSRAAERLARAATQEPAVAGRVRPSFSACSLCKLLPEPARTICEVLCD